MSPKTVFLSSTTRDLAEHREAAYHAIEGLDGWCFLDFAIALSYSGIEKV